MKKFFVYLGWIFPISFGYLLSYLVYTYIFNFWWTFPTYFMLLAIICIFTSKYIDFCIEYGFDKES